MQIKFWNFPKTEIWKNWQQQFDKIFFSKHPFLSYKCDEKILSNQNRSKFDFFSKIWNFSFALFGKTGHFWTWKLQNLDSMGKNWLNPGVWCLGNGRLLISVSFACQSCQTNFLMNLPSKPIKPTHFWCTDTRRWWL